jgi:hypothetical protein
MAKAAGVELPPEPLPPPAAPTKKKAVHKKRKG